LDFINSYSEFRYAECLYAECRYAECPGVAFTHPTKECDFRFEFCHNLTLFKKRILTTNVQTHCHT